MRSAVFITVLASFLFLPLDCFLQEQWVRYDNPPEAGVYYNQTYTLDSGRFTYESNSAIERCVGRGTFRKNWFRMVFEFDSLHAPMVFCRDSSPPDSMLTFSLDEQSDKLFNEPVYIIQGSDTVAINKPEPQSVEGQWIKVEYWGSKDPPWSISYHGGEIELLLDNESLLIIPESESCSFYDLFYKRFAAHKSYMSGERIVMRRGFFGYYHRYMGYKRTAKGKFKRKIVTQRFRPYRKVHWS